MLVLSIKDNDHIKDLLKLLPVQAKRALEQALDQTARDIKKAEVEEMKRVFHRPTRFTLNSLKMTATHNHNMEARVWFKDLERMRQHYIVPQVVGGPRKFKGFEHAFGKTMFVPGQKARMTKAGNISPGQILQILSVLGKAERMAGTQRNMTARSAKRNKKQRDYVYLPKGNGRLYPGVYQRFAKGSRGVRSGTYQALQRGRKRGRIASAIRARGLRPIMLVGKQKASIKPLLHFYEVANAVSDKQFIKHFNKFLDKQLMK